VLCAPGGDGRDLNTFGRPRKFHYTLRQFSFYRLSAAAFLSPSAPAKNHRVCFKFGLLAFSSSQWKWIPACVLKKPQMLNLFPQVRSLAPWPRAWKTHRRSAQCFCWNHTEFVNFADARGVKVGTWTLKKYQKMIFLYLFYSLVVERLSSWT